MIPINRLFGVLLAALLALSSLPVSSPGQAASVTPVSSSSDSDSTKDDVLVGFLVVVVGILLWLGYQSDRDRRKHAAVQASIEEYARAGTLPWAAEEDVLLPDPSAW